MINQEEKTGCINFAKIWILNRCIIKRSARAIIYMELEKHDLMKNTRRVIKDRFRSGGRDSSWKTRRANVEIYLPFDELNFVPERGKQSRMIYIPAEKQLDAICIIFPFINYSIWPFLDILCPRLRFPVCYGINFQSVRNSIDRWDAGITCYRKHVNRVFHRSWINENNEEINYC